MSELEKVYTSTPLTHVSNYSGVFNPSGSYEKFDFVYNTGDGLFYYAMEDLHFGGEVELSFQNRFTLDPNGPTQDGFDTYYIYDEQNLPEDILEPGQLIEIDGSSFESDGLYKIIDIEAGVQEPIYFNDENTLSAVLGATDLSNGWLSSSWFFRPNLGETREIDEPNLYTSDNNWCYHTFWGWIYVSLLNNGNKEFWFYHQSSEAWFWVSINSLGTLDFDSNSFVYLSSVSNGSLGSEGWLQFFNADGISENYKAVIKNHTDGNFYAMLQDLTFTQIEVPDIITSEPPDQVVPQRVSSITKTRIQIQSADQVSSIKQYEPFGENLITISTIDKDINNNQDSWTNNTFFFDADYGSTVSFRANNYKYEFGNGYYTVQPKNINSLNFEVDLKFKNRTNKEANAIIHFLENHQGQHEKDKPVNYLKYTQGISGFYWGTFHPYDSNETISKKFYCQDFSHSLNFENDNDVNVKLRNLDTSILQKSDAIFLKSAPTYSDQVIYERNDVVFDTGNYQYYYYHNTENFSEPQAAPPVEMHATWSKARGNFSEINKEHWTRDFFWKPSVGINVSQSPRMHQSSLGAGYTQIYRDGINESLLILELQFNNRDDFEAYSILHFLEQHYGCIPFMFSAPAPYDAPHNFICQEWTHTYNYKNNHSISAKFEQYALDLNSDQIIDDFTPTDLSPAEIIIPNVINFTTENDVELNQRLGLGGKLRKRVEIQNIGETLDVIHSMHISSDANQYTFLGAPDFASVYTPQIDAFPGISRLTPLNNELIPAIYEYIMGVPQIDDYYITKNNEQGWTVGDLVFALLNDLGFLNQKTNLKNIEILYQDLIGRYPTGAEVVLGLGFNTVRELRNDLEQDDKRYLFLKLNVKIIKKALTGQDRTYCIPENKLEDLGLNGKRIILGKYTEQGQEFKLARGEGTRYFQNNEGVIINLSDNTSTTPNEIYFVNKRTFEIHGENTFYAGEKGYVDIIFGTNYSDKFDYLINEFGETMEWVDAKNRSRGLVVIASENVIEEGFFVVEPAHSEIKSSQINTWVEFENREREYLEINPWTSIESLQAPYCFSDSTTRLFSNNEPYLKTQVILNSEDSSPEENLVNHYVAFEVDPANLDDYIGMWVPYEIKALSTDGGILMPRSSVLSLSWNNLPLYLSVEDVNEYKFLYIDETSEAQAQELKFSSQDIDLNLANDGDHALFGVEPIDSLDLPNGYSSGFVQRGLIRIRYAFTDNPDSSVDGFSLQDAEILDGYMEFKQPAGSRYIVAGYSNCWIDGSNNGCGNMEFSVGNFASDYGVIYDGSNRYTLTRKAFGLTDSQYDKITQDLEDLGRTFTYIALVGSDDQYIKYINVDNFNNRNIEITKQDYDSLKDDVLELDLDSSGQTILLFGKNVFSVIQKNESQGLTLSNVIDRWESYVNQGSRKKFVKNEYPSSLKMWNHVIAWDSAFQLANFHMSILNNAYSLTSQGDWFWALHRSSTPSTSNPGLEVNIKYAMDLSDEHKAEVESAVSTIESIIKDDISVDLFVMENHIGRLGNEFVEENVSKVFNYESDFVPLGMKYIKKNNIILEHEGDLIQSLDFSGDDFFARRSVIYLSLDPSKLNDGSFNDTVDPVYDGNQFTAVYYSVVNQLMRAFGVGELWANNHNWWSTNTNTRSAYNLSYYDENLFNQYSGVNAVREYRDLIDFYTGTIFNVADFDSYVDQSASLTEQFITYQSGGGELSKADWGFNYWETTGQAQGDIVPVKNSIDNFYYDTVPIANDATYLRSVVRYFESIDKIQPVFPAEISTKFPTSARAPELSIINIGAAVSKISIGMIEDLGYSVSYGPSRPNGDKYLIPNINLI